MLRRLWVCSAVLTWAVAAAAADPPAATADKPTAGKATPEEAAKAHFLKGKELYAQGDFDGAVREWEAAYARVPKPELLFNIGRACEQAGRLEDAIKRYRRYLDEAKDPPDRPSVETAITRLQEQLSGRAQKDGDARRQERAAERTRKGRELYQAGKYTDALKELQAAFEIVPSSTLIYNMAKTREKLGDLPGALRDYERYLEMEPGAGDKGDVEYVIRALEKKVAKNVNELSLESNPPGADVYLDDQEKIAGQTPLSLKMNAGPHKLRVAHNGYEPATRDFAMPEDRPLTLTFDLRPLENVGYLAVECDQDGSHIFLDGTILALTPYKERRALPAGHHQVVLERDGYQRFTQMVDIQTGRETRLRVRLESTSGRSKAPVLLAPMVGVFFVVGGGIAAGVAGALWVRARGVIDGTPAWIRAILGMSGAAAGTVLLVFTGVTLTFAIIITWIALGFVGGAGSDVSVRPVTDAPPPVQKPEAPAPATPPGGAP